MIDSQIFNLDGTDSVFAPTDDLSELARSGVQKKNRRSRRVQYKSMTGSELKRSRANNNKETSPEPQLPNMEYLDTDDFIQQKLTPSTDTHMAASDDDSDDEHDKFNKGIAIYSTNTLTD